MGLLHCAIGAIGGARLANARQQGYGLVPRADRHLPEILSHRRHWPSRVGCVFGRRSASGRKTAAAMCWREPSGIRSHRQCGHTGLPKVFRSARRRSDSRTPPPAERRGPWVRNHRGAWECLGGIGSDVDRRRVGGCALGRSVRWGEAYGEVRSNTLRDGGLRLGANPTAAEHEPVRGPAPDSSTITSTTARGRFSLADCRRQAPRRLSEESCCTGPDERGLSWICATSLSAGSRWI